MKSKKRILVTVETDKKTRAEYKKACEILRTKMRYPLLDTINETIIKAKGEKAWKNY